MCWSTGKEARFSRSAAILHRGAPWLLLLEVSLAYFLVSLADNPKTDPYLMTKMHIGLRMLTLCHMQMLGLHAYYKAVSNGSSGVQSEHASHTLLRYLALKVLSGWQYHRIMAMRIFSLQGCCNA